MKDSIAIIDLGGQYCHLIRRRLRDLGYRSEIFWEGVRSEQLKEYRGVILSGGPQSVYEKGAPSIDERIVRLGKPVLGICYGHQLLAYTWGGDVRAGSSEYGAMELQLTRESRLFEGAPADTLNVWMSHGDSVMEPLPAGFESVAVTEGSRTAAFADEARHLYGVQFHPEVDHTQFGTQLLDNFAQICGLTVVDPNASRVPEILEEIREKVGGNKVFFLVSGGVDSMVAFALCAKALGPEAKDRLRGLYVNTGFMRLGEDDELRENLAALGLTQSVRILDASEEFFRKLADEDDPEKKRKIIGRLFVEVQAIAMQELGVDDSHWFLGQGTIYPDTIESGGKGAHGGKAALIKTHHNRCEEIRALLEKGRVVEPLADLYKDEVRKVGRDLGLSATVLNRWPFPGPGLAIRVLCRSSNEEGKATLLNEPLNETWLRPYKAYALPVKTVGVQGDARTYKQALMLQGPFDYKRLREISSRYVNTSRDFNRATYVLATVPGASIAEAVAKRGMLDRERVSVLQQAEAIVRRVIGEAGLLTKIWQFPVILLPVRLAGREVVVLRPIDSLNGMTASFTELEGAIVYRIAGEILDTCDVGAVLLDITNKPPATIEWE